MEVLISNFGIQPVYLAAQVINFLILLYILKRFMYQPILKVLEDRKKTSVENLKNEKFIARRLQEINKESEIHLSSTCKQSKKMLKQAAIMAEQIVKDAHQKAAQDAEMILETGRIMLTQEKEQIKRELKQELAELVLLTAEKYLDKKMTVSDDKKLVEQILQKMNDGL